MQLKGTKEHPNGLEVLVASHLAGQKVDVEVKRGKTCGPRDTPVGGLGCTWVS